MLHKILSKLAAGYIQKNDSETEKSAKEKVRVLVEEALNSQGYMIFTSRLVKKGGYNADEELIHTFSFGQGFKLADIPISFKKYREMAETKMAKENASAPPLSQIVSPQPLQTKEIPLSSVEGEFKVETSEGKK